MPSVQTDRFLAKLLREDYYAFFLEFWELTAAEKLNDAWYIKELCRELQTPSERVFSNKHKLYDLVWNCPPGTSKSTIVSVLWQTWIWTRMPSARFISGSYSERLALDLSRKSRDVVKSDKYRRLFSEIQLREDQDTKGYFANTLGGMRYATGVGGSVLGMHAHFIGIDDAIDPQGALSDLMLLESNTWCSETLSRRKVDVMVTFTAMIQQRLHQDDTTGHFLSKGLPVKHFILPCDISWEVQPSEYKDRYEDGLLDPVRLGPEALEQAKKDLLDAGYSCQYGQSPIPRGTAKFKVDRIQKATVAPMKWKKPPIRYWDNAASQKKGAFTVGVKMGLDLEEKLWILDVERFQLDSGGREKRKWKVAQEDGKLVRIFEEQEPSGAGKQVAEANTKMWALRGYSFEADLQTGRGDKELRADPVSGMVNSGNMILLVGDWNAAYINELRFFPASKYKDQVDATSGGYGKLSQRKRRRIGAL